MNFHGSNPKRWLGYAAVALALSGVGCAIAASGVSQEQSEFFEKRIRPLLIENCLECHGDKKQKGGLRLDMRDGWVHGGDSGPALVPHQPEKSLIYHAVRYGDKKLEMPPKGRLSVSQIEDIRQWIQMGAPDPRISIPLTRQPKNQMSLEKGRSFWSLQPLREPSVPHVGDTEWSVHPIDAFIRQSQIQKDIHPAPGADAYALVRRLYIDLIGLPPTPAEIQEFVSDPSEHAWEMLVDKLLASKHFGERWGRHWLDVARYAESSGGGRTLMFPEAWRYRDYVIEAFNQDMPYDQFIQEQLAGDLMESDTWMEAQRRLTATGFLLLGPTNYELQDKDILEMDIIDEQLDTIGKAFMGLTLGCARCHDHKFDPIPTSDYYALAGIFKSTRVVEHDNVSTWATRQLPEDPVTQSAIDQKYSEIAALKSEISQLRKSIESEKKIPRIVGTEYGEYSE
ncbi:MAG: DUF1549 domain-containing protein [Verrucomicrobia bacterium]|nr:DUF1549 domain-containing protein [Verrucomicrobiota bacterium]